MGLYSSTTSVFVADRMKPCPVRPPMTYMLPSTTPPNAWLRGTDMGRRLSHLFVAGLYTSLVPRTRDGPKKLKNGSLAPSVVVAPPIT